MLIKCQKLSVKYRQFLTSKETAILMAGLFDVNADKSWISVFDPGAGLQGCQEIHC